MSLDKSQHVARLVKALTGLGYAARAGDTSDPVGLEPDIILDYHAVVVEHDANWRHAVGTVLFHAKKHHSKPVVLLVGAAGAGPSGYDVARWTLRGVTPTVQVWLFDPATGTLDMGDGRTTEV